jgi:hypothetical protein
MDWEQALRRQWRDWRQGVSQAGQRAGDAGTSLGDAGREVLSDPRAGLVARATLVLLLVLLVIYPLLAWLSSTVDDDPGFAPSAVRPHMSHAVAAAAALLDREVNGHGWAPNTSWFSPRALLDNMPNYQRGVVAALARSTLALSEANSEGSVDADLQSAAALLQYPPDMGVWNPSVSIWPTATSEAQYRRGIDALEQYNRRLAEGQATLETSSQNLARILDAVAAGLASDSVRIEDYVRAHGGFPFDSQSDDIFYEAKGRMYADYVVLRGVQADFAGAIARPGVAKPWHAAMSSLRAAIALRPEIVLNGAPDSDLFACTLCGEGLYLAQARGQLHDLAELLR